ncbi:hypothetical protein QJS10_CPA06g01578 [Acorus calamus]|uniref:SOSEKI DIX-like domain-containing protein n=1 Tax=Acorus calamus TaxID=4465 RepID=A0AAV9ERK9_ACOCL|nr:hypothetical protein QJS10_CPA06g01578 [Acorus calamus]
MTRKYKSGYVWQDVLRDDHLITPVSDNEYVLKGSLITSSISPSNQDEIKRTGESDQLPVRVSGVDGSRRALGTEGIHHQRPPNHASGGRINPE